MIKLTADPSRVHGLPRSLFVHPWVAVLATAVPVIFAESAFCRAPIYRKHRRAKGDTLNPHDRLEWTQGVYWTIEAIVLSL